MTEITDAKLSRFVNSIIKESDAEANGILSELEKKRALAIKDIETRLSGEVAEYYERRSAEITACESGRVSSNAAQNKLQLLQFREDCAKAVFAEVREKIAEFTASEEYPEHLGKLLGKAVSQLGYGFAAEVALRPEDMKYADLLLKKASGVSLAFVEGSFELGGLRLTCRARGKRVDLSFDSAILDLVGHFSELTGMHVEEL